MTATDKLALRVAGLAHRESVGAEAVQAFAMRLGRIGPELARAHGARAVSVFWSIGSEVPTQPLLEALHAADLVVGLPVTGKRGTRLVFRRWTPEMPMVSGRMGILEPSAASDEVVPDLLFVPLAVFDRRGHRIGYGAGFYDVTLAALRAERPVLAVGIAYAGQEILYVPSEAHDQPLDFIITEAETIACADAA